MTVEFLEKRLKKYKPKYDTVLYSGDFVNVEIQLGTEQIWYFIEKEADIYILERQNVKLYLYWEDFKEYFEMIEGEQDGNS